MLARLFNPLCSISLFFSLFILADAAAETGSVVYTGLSRDKARFEIDGRAVFLEPGERGPDGIQVMIATQDKVVVNLNDEVYEYKKDSSKPHKLDTTVKLTRSRGGAFFSRGGINGYPVAFVVDTGASYVSMNSREAKRLDIRYRRGERVEISTAAKKETAYRVTLDSVQLEGIVVKGVQAVVIPGKFPEVILLGNSFLHHVTLQQAEDQMVLIKK